MGIKNFHVWLHEKFPTAFIPITNNNIYEYIYIDLNFILHNSIYSCRTEKDFMHRLTNNLDILFSNVMATKEIFFAIDGPSSFAKIILQRQRRLTNSNTSQKNPKAISSLCLTPGISIMARIEAQIRKYIEGLQLKYKFNKPKCTVSFSNEPNEGEIKICKKVIENGKSNLSFRHLIIGNDSDLIVLAMGMKPVYNINILIKAKEHNEILSLKHLLHAHCKFIGRDDKIEVLTHSNFREDFIVLSIMMGNDYLPKVAFIKYENLWKLYKELISKNEIKLPNNNNHSEITLINSNNTFNIDVISNFMLLIYNGLSKNHKEVNVNTYNKKQASSYLEGILWCVNMYKTGNCTKYDYMYTNNSPHPHELLFHICSEKDNIKYTPTDFKPISTHVYPLIIMPKGAISLLTVAQQKLMSNELKYLYEREECIPCHKFKTDMGEIRKQVMCNEDIDIKSEFQKKYKIIENKYKNHIILLDNVIFH